jgi:hypothetical protein
MAKSQSKTPRRTAAARGQSPPRPESANIPKGFKRKKFIRAADAHLLVARTAASMAAPPFICVPTGPPPAPCLRYGLDPATGLYAIPPFGQVMDCTACRGS